MKKIVTLLISAYLIITMTACGTSKEALADKKVVIGTNAEYEPFEYLDENSELTGFDIELANAIGEKMGVEVEWIDMPFDSLIGSMESGNVEMIAAAIGPTEERKRSCDFSDVYYSGYQSIIVNNGSTMNTFESLNGKTVAVLEGSLSDMIASGENQGYGVIENTKVKRFKNATQAIEELENGAADAVIIDSIIADRFVKDRDNLVAYPIDSTGENTVFAIKKGDIELINAVNNALSELKEDGTYDSLYDKYFAE